MSHASGLASSKTLPSLVIREQRFAIELHLSLDHNGDIAPFLQKLHNLSSLACQLRPARSGFRVLFESTQLVPPKLKIHLAQSGSARPPDRKTAVLQGHRPNLFDQDLSPYGSQRL